MATYPPPNYTEPLPVFNPINWEPQVTANTTIDINYANANYLKYPVAQGTETTQNIIVNGTAQFDSNVTVGSSTTTNLTPTIATNKSQINLGTAGNGSVDVECSLNVGGYGAINMTSSNINLNSGARLNQGVLTTTTNVLASSEVLSSYGASTTSTLYVQDSSGAQGINFIPNASGGAYNPIVSGNDCEIFAKGSASNTKNLTLTAWGSQNSGVRITPTNTLIGYGGFTPSAPTTATLYDGTNITITSPNPPLSTATQPATSDNSNKMPTTSWVQSLFATLPSPVNTIPYFKFSQLTTVNSSRQGTPFGFSFNGASGWTALDFFTVRLTVTCITSSSNYNLTCIMDIYPALCPANTAYGSTSNNATGVVSVNPFAQMNGNIWSGSQYYSSYVVPIDATYNPLGRWYNPTSFQLTNNLGIAVQPNCLPIYPYITNATQKTNFGFQLWSLSTVTFPNQFVVMCELLGNTTSQPVSSYGVNQFTNYYASF